MSFPRPPLIIAPHAKSALTRVGQTSAASVKATVSELFTSLSNFVILAGTPTITSSKLTGSGAVRYRDELSTDNFKVTATVGAVNTGTCRIVTCANDSFDRFYALEIYRDLFTQTASIVKGTAATATTSYGIFGILIGLLSFFLGGFGASAQLTKYATVNVTVAVDDTLAVWWDEHTSTIRVYQNDSEVTSLPVSHWEIPHGKGSRYFGVLHGDADLFGGTGPQFTSIEAEDV